MSEQATMTRDERTELFLLQVRGNMATAFQHSGVVPTNDDWCVLRGVDEPTLRHLGEIGYRTGFNMHLQLVDIPKPRPEPEAQP